MNQTSGLGTGWRAGAFALLLALAGGGYLILSSSAAPRPAPAAPGPLPPEAGADQVKRFCSACHAYPPPDTFPRSAWRLEVKGGYDFFRNSRLQMDAPNLEDVVRYYEKRAPEVLPQAARTVAPGPLLPLKRQGYAPPGARPAAGVTNVSLGRLLHPGKLDVLVCQTSPGQVWALQAYATPPVWRLLGPVLAPAHAEVVDLDGDGIADVLAADLGSFYPTDDLVGRVVWLRGSAQGDFTPVTLLEGVGRVADVQAADFRGRGQKDLVVAVFGWRSTGSILYLENRTTDWSHPVFVPHVLDDRHGAINVCVADINGDGRPDVVALISQQHETIVAFLNQGDGTFHKETIYTAPHPAYGSSGIQVVDLNGDGRPDVLYTNGDTLGYPYLLKPYHGIQWLENRGKFPWVHHPLAAMPGVMRAVAADVDGDGDLDILAVSYLPRPLFPEREQIRPDAVVLLEQTKPGQFRRHVLETTTCDHFTCAVGDVLGDGKMHLVTGSFCVPPASCPDAVAIWRTLGPGQALR